MVVVEICDEVSPHNIICGILDVGGLLTWEKCPNGRETYTDVRGDVFVDVPTLGWNRIWLRAIEIWVEVFPPQYNLRNLRDRGSIEVEGAGKWSWNFYRR